MGSFPDGFTAERISELVVLIRECFSDIPKPLVTKRCGVLLDDEWYPTIDRFDEVRALDVEENWWDVTDQEVEEYGHSLFWLDPEGFRFYFPRFLTHALENWDVHHFEVFDMPTIKFELLHDFSIKELEFISEIYAEIESRGDKTYNWSNLWYSHLLRIDQIKQLARMRGQ